MKKTLLFLLSISLALNSCKAQTHETHYITGVIKGSKLLALTVRGSINSFDINTGAAIDTNIQLPKAITAIAINKKGEVFVADKDNTITILNETSTTFKQVRKVSDKVYAMLFDSKDRLYVLGAKGITDVVTGKVYYPDTSFRLNRQINVAWSAPSADFMDNNDNIWIGADYGEWGGQLIVFDTRNKRFVKLDAANAKKGNYSIFQLSGIASFCTDGVNVYASMGLQHLFSSGGAIIKFNKFRCDSVVISRSHWVVDKSNPELKKMDDGYFIGPMLYNPKDGSLYFYSQYGVFKGNIQTNLSKMENWTKVFQPSLHWVYGRSNAAGAPMTVAQMEIAANGNMFLITRNDGIGMFDGKTFKLLN